MTRSDDSAVRDFVHTVDVLTASALAEHERVKAGAAPVRHSVRQRYGAVAAAACGVLALFVVGYGGYEYTRSGPPQTSHPQSIATAPSPAAPSAASPPSGEDASRRRMAEAEVRSPQAEKAEPRVTQTTRLSSASERAEARRRPDAEAEAKRIAEAQLEAKRVAEAESMRVAMAEEARRVAEADEAAAARARADADAKRVADARAAEKRARLDAEEKRQAEADAAARQRAEEDRVAMIDARRRADSEAEQRIAATTLNADERATFVRRVQEVLKVSHCYQGAVNGNDSEAQKGLDRFVDSARKKGKDRPVRIELAKATANDFDDWLREADSVKSDLCVAPKPRPPAMVQKEPRPLQQREARPQRSYSSTRERYGTGAAGGGGGGGGRGGGPIQGIQ